MQFPQKGMPREELLSTLHALKSDDTDWKNARAFSLIYNAGEDIKEFAEEAFSVFINENGLSPFAFPSLLKMETEMVSMTASLLGGDSETVGSMTSGGTESIMMAVKAAR
ncbi:MAG: aspartate aminotransferase family protein, partial [Dehalococcoidia bacterium]|nr:aspartate aminotransferase family protein [Dehalococcoidia bacterium]